MKSDEWGEEQGLFKKKYQQDLIWQMGLSQKSEQT